MSAVRGGQVPGFRPLLEPVPPHLPARARRLLAPVLRYAACAAPPRPPPAEGEGGTGAGAGAGSSAGGLTAAVRAAAARAAADLVQPYVAAAVLGPARVDGGRGSGVGPGPRG